MRTQARRRDEDDVIRARLRALLAEGRPAVGWVPDEDPDEDGDDDEETEPDPSLTEPDVALPAGLGRHRAPGHTARLDPGRPSAWAMWAVAVLAALAVVGWTWWERPGVEQVPAAASAPVQTTGPPTSSGTATGSAVAPEGTAGPVVVSVVGQVVAPGLVTLPAGSRIADALAAVGGLLPEADPAAVNAAAVLVDGQQIAVGVAGAPPAAAAAATDGGGLLDLNAATAADLDALPGIGPVLAQRIVDHRDEHGPFASIDQLDDVSGIGPAIFAELAGRVRV